MSDDPITIALIGAFISAVTTILATWIQTKTKKKWPTRVGVIFIIFCACAIAVAWYQHRATPGKCAQMAMTTVRDNLAAALKAETEIRF